eukprot:scaffold26476_cov84-Skeletonema_marinoi.AAC.2
MEQELYVTLLIDIETMGTETLYPHFLSFHASCGLIMHVQTIWQRACQHDIDFMIDRKSDVIKQDQHLNF